MAAGGQPRRKKAGTLFRARGNGRDRRRTASMVTTAWLAWSLDRPQRTATI